ncbi:hypothetical protein, partial [Staphylococcus epidermidis]|uniref:hypothetical protein n=1 Tax=Staphylococcus epidermidis TaxID=1282 RepID=UPI001C930ADC
LHPTTEYYVSKHDDHSAFPPPTFFHPSNTTSPYNLPTSSNILPPSHLQPNPYITTKPLKHPYQSHILFNTNHKPHQYIYYSFPLPTQQTPTP